MSKIIINDNDDLELKSYIGEDEVNKVMAGSETAYLRFESNQPEPDYFCITCVEDKESTVSMVGTGSNLPTLTLYTSTDKRNWTRWNDVTSAITISSGGKLYMYGENRTFSKAESSYWTMSISGSTGTGLSDVALSGDITTLLTRNGNVESFIDEGYGDYIFNSFFENNNYIVSASGLKLPTLVMRPYSYFGMFYKCSYLIDAPELPATSLSEGCYQSMFNGCERMTKHPSELPALKVTNNCYNKMFYGCKAITTAPVMWCEDRANTGVNNYFVNMYYNCSSLRRIQIHMTYWNTSYSSNWVYGVYNATVNRGFFKCCSSLSISSGTSGKPTTWTKATFTC